jgi:predicted phosphodiesterase
LKYAVISDVHSNLTALEAVFKDIEDHHKADEIWCLGDIVGYGPDPHECITLIRATCASCVAGNHDWAAVRKIDTIHFNIAAAEAVVWTRKQLSPEDIKFLENLPAVRIKGDLTLTHGSPRDPIWEYILSEGEAEENLPYFDTRICLIGHSHLPMLYECENRCTLIEPVDGMRVKLTGKRFIINPGAVGQPRNHDPRASYAIYDSGDSTIIYHRVKYDVSVEQQRMKEAGLPERLINRLAFGQ